MVDDDDEYRPVAFLAPQFVVDLIDQAAAASLTNRSTFLRMAVWRELKREGWAAQSDPA
jgi:hypothetical protein